MGNVKLRLVRLKALYDQYVQNFQNLQAAQDRGKRKSLAREHIFLKNKILSGLNKIEAEMQPKIFKVEVMDHNQNIQILHLVSDDPNDIFTYITYLGRITKREYHILDIKEIPAVINKTQL